MTSGREANTAHVVTGKTAPPGHEPYHQAAPESVLADVMGRDAEDLSATEQIRQAQDWAAGTGHLLTLWSAAVRQALYPDIDQQIKARLTDSEAWRYDREHSHQALQQRLRAAQLAGHDIAALIYQITAAPMDGARSISSVLHGRLQQLALPDLRHDATWAQRTPASAPAVARELAAGWMTGSKRSANGWPSARSRGWPASSVSSPPVRPPRCARNTRDARAWLPPTGKPPGSLTRTTPSPSSRIAGTPNSKPCVRQYLLRLRSVTKPTSSAACTAASSKPGSSPGNAPRPAPRPTSAARCGSLRRPRPTPCSNRQTPRCSMTYPGRRAPRPSHGSWPPNGSGSKLTALDTRTWSADTRDIRAAADKARAELQRRGHAQLKEEPQAQPDDEPQTTAGWWRQFEADLQAAERAIDRQHQAAIDTGEPWPPQRTAEPNPSSAPEPDAGPTPKASPEEERAPAKPDQDGRTTRLAELLARADQATRRIAARQAERQASNEYAARIEREAQAEPEAKLQAEARDQAEIEM